jgi:hypothetical protein
VTSDEASALGRQAAENLARTGACKTGPGMTDAELTRVEQEYGFEFADDHRAFLAVGLPLNTPIQPVEGVFHAHARPWPDWRDGDPGELREALDRPVQGVLFDVEQGHWHDTWGPRPEDQAEARKAAEEHLATVPRMIPVYGHRYLPGGRSTYGHSVLSIWQTDMICYGTDLVDYIYQEFGGQGLDRHDPRWQPRVTVPFWSDFL